MGRRAFVLVAVLVIGVSAILVATSVIFLATAERAGAASDERRGAARAIARSGLLVLMNRLDTQRDLLLDGGQPELDESYTLFESGSRASVVRLLPLGPAGELLVPEAAKLDVNRVTAAMLEATTFVDPDLASSIVAYRSSIGGFRSIAQLLDVPGVTPDVLYGPLEDIDIMRDVRGEELGLGARVAERLGGAEIRGLADLLTVFAHEPAIQRSGDRRIALDVPWSEELGSRLDDRFGEGAGEIVKRLMESTAFTSEGQLYRVFGMFNTPAAEWPDIVDAVMAANVPYHVGRLDINRAPYEALLGLPGLDPADAAAIVEIRSGLDAETRATIAWPATESLLDAADYEVLADWMTARSWTWRVRLAAGEVSLDDPEGPLIDPVVFEAVIDLSDPAARVAYLRDITLLDAAARLALRYEGSEDEGDDWIDEADPADPEPESADFPDGDGVDELVTDPAPESEEDPMEPANDQSESQPSEAAAPVVKRVGRWHGGGA